VLINAQIAAGYALTLRLRHGDAFLRHAYGCPKNFNSLLSSIRRIIQTRGHARANPRGQAAVWVDANFVGPLLHADAHPPGGDLAVG